MLQVLQARNTKAGHEQLFGRVVAHHQTDCERCGLCDLEGEKTCATTSPAGLSKGSFFSVSQIRESALSSPGALPAPSRKALSSSTAT